MFTAKGNTAGFTAQGRPVCGKYFPKSKSWKVWTDEFERDRRSFATKAEAESFAATLIDTAKTTELAWW